MWGRVVGFAGGCGLDSKFRHVVGYLDRVRGSWVEGFVAWKQRGDLHGGSPNERSLSEYAYILFQVERKYGLSLQTATLDDANHFLDEYRAKHALNGYIQVVSVIKDALNYLKRREISGELLIPKRSPPEENISLPLRDFLDYYSFPVDSNERSVFVLR